MRGVPEDPRLRRMALATLVNTTGNGISFTLSALYFTRIVGLSVAQVGLGLSIAGALALGAGIPLGHLADRRGPREVQVVLLVGVAAVSAVYLLVEAWWQFVVLSSIIAILQAGANTVRNALISVVTTGSERGATKAYLRSITNIGMTLGTGVAALALHADTREAYRAVMYLDVLTYLVAAVVLLGLPHVAPSPAGGRGGMLVALRDRPYVLVVAVSSVLTMHYWILELAVPLWVVEHTRAPHALVSVLLVINTVVVVLAQVAVARRVATPVAAARAALVSGVLFVGACVLLGLADDDGPLQAGATLAAVLLVGGALVHVVGELCQASSSFLLSFELAREESMGQYQGVWSLGYGVSSLAAPTVMALLPLGLGLIGWLLLGAILLAAAAATGPVVRHALRSRADSPVLADI